MSFRRNTSTQSNTLDLTSFALSLELADQLAPSWEWAAGVGLGASSWHASAHRKAADETHDDQGVAASAVAFGAIRRQLPWHLGLEGRIDFQRGFGSLNSQHIDEMLGVNLAL
jgi:hypothetical protein